VNKSTVMFPSEVSNSTDISHTHTQANKQQIERSREIIEVKNSNEPTKPTRGTKAFSSPPLR